MDLSEVTEDEIKIVTKLLNNRPRKCLNYNTPNESMSIYRIVALDLQIYHAKKKEE